VGTLLLRAGEDLLTIQYSGDNARCATLAPGSDVWPGSVPRKGRDCLHDERFNKNGRDTYKDSRHGAWLTSQGSVLVVLLVPRTDRPRTVRKGTKPCQGSGTS